MRALVCLLAACEYVQDPAIDPADPTVLSLFNVSDSTLYLTLNDSGSLMDAAITVNGARTALSCAERACTDTCDAAPCQVAPSVRALLPGEAYEAHWNNLYFAEASNSCGACMNVTRVEEGRVDVIVCYGRGVSAGGTRMSPQVIANATITDETCLAPVNIGVPRPEVRYGFELH